MAPADGDTKVAELWAAIERARVVEGVLANVERLRAELAVMRRHGIELPEDPEWLSYPPEAAEAFLAPLDKARAEEFAVQTALAVDPESGVSPDAALAEQAQMLRSWADAIYDEHR